MKKIVTAVIITAITVILVVLMTAGGKNAEDSIIVAGSTSVQPYAEILVEAFEILYPGYEVDIQGGGSSAGIRAVEAGTADIGMSSRPLKADELEVLNPVVIAFDGLALVVHPKNPVKNLTLQQIFDIYSGNITNWKEVGGTDAKIYVITREEGSGTREAFEKQMEELNGENIRITSKAIVLNSNGAVKQTVSSGEHFVGFISLGLALEKNSGVDAVSIENVAATEENVANGSYVLYREFLFVTDGEPEGLAKRFIDFVLSEKGREILAGEGLIPPPAD